MFTHLQKQWSMQDGGQNTQPIKYIIFSHTNFIGHSWTVCFLPVVIAPVGACLLL